MIPSRALSPRAAIWLVASCLAIGLAASVYRIPIQASDSLELFERVAATPSIARLFVSSVTSSSTNLRPMRDVQSALLVRVADGLGIDETHVFRGYHALGAVLLVVAFTAALRVRDWTDAAAGMFALTVLLGLHTTLGLFEEAFPINHFLLVALGTLVMLLVARTPGSRAIDVLVTALAVFVTLTVESGLLLLPVAVVVYLAEGRGITRSTIAGLTVVLGVYVLLRMGLLGMMGSTLGDRATGFGLTMLDGDALRARFGASPSTIYAYTVASQALTVVLSQPIEGVWTAVRDWRATGLAQYELVAVTSSIVTTALVVWYLLSTDADGVRGFRRSAAGAFLVVLVGSAVLSYAYAKTDVMSAAGVLYALVAFHAVRHLLGRSITWSRPVVGFVAVLAVGVSLLWTTRAAGLQYQLERAAFGARNEWVRDPDFSLDAHTHTVVASSLRRQALRRPTTNPYLMPPFTTRLWGEP